MCRKSFKKAGGLIGHLRSPFHGDKTYTCPSCFKKFKSLTAVAAHTESASQRCHIRFANGYTAYMDQLSGGIVDVDHELHHDGTVKYHTSDASRKMFGNGEEAEQAKAELEVQAEPEVKAEPVWGDSAWTTQKPEVKVEPFWDDSVW